MGKIFPTTIFLCGILLVTGVTCGKKPERLSGDAGDAGASLEQSRPQELTRQLSDIKYSHSEEGKVQWELLAAGVQQALDGPTRLQDVTITYYAEDGRVTVVRADTGLYDAATNNAELQGDVLVNTSDGIALSTEMIRWDQQTSLLTGPGEVKIAREDSVVEGKGFELSPEADAVTIFDVSGIIRQEENKS